MLFLFGIGDKIYDSVVGLFLGIAGLFFRILKHVANLFHEVGLCTVLQGYAEPVYQRVGLILGLFMLFKLTFHFIQMIIDPDIITDKQKGVGNIIKRIIIVVILFGITPKIFSVAYTIQDKLLNNGDDIIKEIILGSDPYTADFGAEFSADLFSSFIEDGDKRDEFRNKLVADDASYTEAAPAIDSIGLSLLAIIVGAATCWIFFVYAVSLSLRLVQLFFLELIAPVPIMSYISTEKETALNKWAKQCIFTYVDVFLRFAILYIVCFVVGIITNINFSYSGTGGYFGSLIFKILLIWGILLFMKKAPELIKEIFPGMSTAALGELGFGLKGRTEIPDIARRAVGGTVGMPVNAIGRMASRVAANAFENKHKGEKPTKGMFKAMRSGFFTGAGAGFVGGFTGKGITGGIGKDMRAKNKVSNARYVSNKNNDYTTGERIADLAAEKLGFTSYIQKLKNDKAIQEMRKSGMEIYSGLYKDMKDESRAKLESAEYKKAEFNTEAGLRVREIGIQATAAINYANTLKNSTSTARKNLEISIRDNLKDSGLTTEELEKEVSRQMADYIAQAEYDADVKTKEWDKAYITFAVNEEQAGDAKNAVLIRKLEETEKIAEQFNAKAPAAAKINFELSNSEKSFDWGEFDAIFKSKTYTDANGKEHDYTSTGVSAVISDVNREKDRIDREISEHQDKIDGNKSGQ